MTSDESDAVAMRMLNAAAAAGAPAPSNRELAKAMECLSTSWPGYVLSRLTRRGLIVIHSNGCQRQVTIVASGLSTQAIDLSAAQVPEPIDRDPCFRCGTRADVGCAHNPRVAA